MRKIILEKKAIFYEIANKNDSDKYSLLKKLTMEAFGVNIILKKKNNKPYISNNENLFCSISDSKDIVFVAVCNNYRIGADVEYLQPRKNELLSYCGSQTEISLLNKLPLKIKNLETIIWSLKESVQKSDEIISDAIKYRIVAFKKNKVWVQRDQKKWLCGLFIENNYVFSISVKTT